MLRAEENRWTHKGDIDEDLAAAYDKVYAAIAT